MTFQKEILKTEIIDSFENIKKKERLRRIKNIIESPELSQDQKKDLEVYHSFLQRKGLRLESQRAYLQNLKLLFKAIPKKPTEITKGDIDKYISMLEDVYKPKTIKERKMFLLKFFEYTYNKKKAEIPLISDLVIKNVNGMKLPEELLSPEEIKKIVQAADNFRDKAMIILLYETAARKGEFMQLKIKHLEIKEDNKKKYGYVTIPMGKTDSRKVPIIYSLSHIINWLNSHPNRDNPEAPLFITSGSYLGRALGEDGLKRRLAILGKRAGIKKHIYPHLFRHSRLTELAKELTEQELKIYAGWTPDSNMAAVYVHLSGQDVSDKVLANAGLIDYLEVHKGKKVLMQIECPSCHKLNSPDIKICQCGKILDIKEAQKEIDNYKGMEERLRETEKQLSKISESLIELTKRQTEVNLSDTDILKTIIKAVRAKKK